MNMQRLVLKEIYMERSLVSQKFHYIAYRHFGKPACWFKTRSAEIIITMNTCSDLEKEINYVVILCFRVDTLRSGQSYATE